MRRVAPALLLALCALPARGDDDPVMLTDAEKQALTTMDAQPSRSSLDFVFDGAALGTLLDIVNAPAGVDFGAQLRAIRALPTYCLQPCDTGEPHDTLRTLVQTLAAASPQDPLTLLRLRASIEALGATHSADDADVVLLLPLLDHPSRDIRTATAYALRAVPAVCNQQAYDALAAHSRPQNDPSEQVREACSAALRDLPGCSDLRQGLH